MPPADLFDGLRFVPPVRAGFDHCGLVPFPVLDRITGTLKGRP